jgi:hypothetical protein
MTRLVCLFILLTVSLTSAVQIVYFTDPSNTTVYELAIYSSCGVDNYDAIVVGGCNGTTISKSPTTNYNEVVRVAACGSPGGARFEVTLFRAVGYPILAVYESCLEDNIWAGIGGRPIYLSAQTNAIIVGVVFGVALLALAIGCRHSIGNSIGDFLMSTLHCCEKHCRCCHNQSRGNPTPSPSIAMA